MSAVMEKVYGIHSMGELDQISLEIGGLKQQGTDHSDQLGVLFEKMDEIHKCVQSGQKDHHDRITDLESCKDTVENEDRPAMKSMATEIHTINTRFEKDEKNFWKRTALSLLTVLGLGGAGGAGGSWFAKWVGL